MIRTSHLRLVAFAVGVLTPALSESGWTPPVASDSPSYACVRIDPSAADGLQLRIVAADEKCRGQETRMIVVLSETTPFAADGTVAVPTADRTPIPADALFASKILVRFAAIPASVPLLVRATLLVDADLALFSMPPPAAVDAIADARGDPSNVRCAPLVDGRGVGELTPLLPRGASLQLPPGVVMDPLTGRIELSPPGAPPDIFWSRLDWTLAVAAGRHEFAVACAGRLAFQFRGIGNLVVLQPTLRR